ncbi:MAG: glycine/sarcosine/betaine reductase complex component C subunit alpha [bacterium]|jgi:hypothetical protein
MLNDNLKRMLGEVLREMADTAAGGFSGPKPRIGVTTTGSEHGTAEIVRGAEMAQRMCPDLEVILIGPRAESNLSQIPAGDCLSEEHRVMEKALADKTVDAAVTMHYNFPIGVATIGRVFTPGRGREMFLATTTGTMATDRAEAMVLGAVGGIIAAKACGKSDPTVGILNVDGARQAERSLRSLQAGGYQFTFAGSQRADGGAFMRGNDLLTGTPDVMVMDTLTGNVMMKVLSAYTSGGDYEASGFGYGPGIGEGYEPIILILSRASGAPVVAGAVRYAGDLVRGDMKGVAAKEFAAVRAVGLGRAAESGKPEAPTEAAPPPAKTVTEEIPGVDILEIDDAVRILWRRGIFATTGMGCTGPVIMVAGEDKEKAKKGLQESGYLG